MRARLDHHIRERLPDSSGTVATAFATGDQNAISDDDADAMRRSGLAHLLSVGGLHITAAVALAMFLTLKLLALSERIALRFNLVLIAAAAGAAAGIGYTLLTGSQVPMVRSCIAALVVLTGIAFGREAISMRMVAVSALLILAIRPEALVGPSFQLTFAAVGSIISLHSTAWARRAFMQREEGAIFRFGRSISNLLVTGLVVELPVMPFALFHFHKSGLYGVVANIIAIPLTTFVILPLEAAALSLDAIGLGKPVWALTGFAIDTLLWLAHTVASSTRTIAIPEMPAWGFALMVSGGLWLCLWTARPRMFGLIPFAIGAITAGLSSPPDLLVTGDGRHLAILAPEGVPMMLRDRSGGFTQDLVSEASGFDDEPGLLSSAPFGACSRDSCVAVIKRGSREYRILATRSATRIDWRSLVNACADADIAVSDRRLPRSCSPRWLKLDRAALARTGGVAIHLGPNPHVDTVAERLGRHPWALTAKSKSAMPLGLVKGRR